MALIKIFNSPVAPTIVRAVVTTGTNIKTMLQVSADRKFRVVEWGASFEGEAAAQPIAVELLETGTVFATVTAAVESDLVKYDDPDAEAVATELGVLVGTSLTGYTASSEGTITASRVFDGQLIAPTNQYVIQFPLGREPVINHDTSLRIRVHAANAENMLCYVLIDI